MRKIRDEDAGTLYAMKVLKKATLKGSHTLIPVCNLPFKFIRNEILLPYLLVDLLCMLNCSFLS